MDYIEITYHDYLAECANCILFDNWLIYDWENHLLNYYNPNKNPLPARDINFSVNDYHIEIYDTQYETEPYTDIVPNVEGRLTTLWMCTPIKIKNGKIRGKMCIRNISDPPLHIEFELSLKDAEIKLLVGFSIDNKDHYDGDYFEFDNSVYTVSSESLSFTYTEQNSKIVSIFDKIADASQKKLLKQYLLDYFTKDIYTAALRFEHERLSIKTTVSDQVGADYSLRNVLRLHNRKLHTAFKNLAEKIISLTNIMVQETSMKVEIKKLFGFISLPNNEKKIQIYHGFISNLHSLKIVNDKYIIVSKKNDLTILHIPVINYQNMEQDKTKQTISDVFSVQSYTVEEAYFVMSLKKLNPSKVEFNLMDFKIMNFKCMSNVQVIMTMDYLITHAVEESMRSCMTEVLKNETLNHLAIRPPVEIEYYGNEFNAEESDDSQMENDSNVGE
ncbi:hypothetical protein TSAR_012950 [Trichomalopsis sarcophagae]|uniref:Uncharacterized protein n=1 Tax=Trichomalopsis sarcophagae TaxID=543379 RepID=A0A232FDY3_9HYME|nr:hypothetical protein TSAR_012950 [Trichomalopsis sarcophagae]